MSQQFAQASKRIAELTRAKAEAARAEKAQAAGPPMGGKPLIKGNWKKVTPEVKAKMTPEQRENLEASSAQAKSIAFYSSIGYPQYGGVYEAFEVPAGARVAAIRQVPNWTGEGPAPLQVALTDDRPKSFATQTGEVYGDIAGKGGLLNIASGGRLNPLAGLPLQQAQAQRATDIFTGAVAAAEGSFYGLGSLVTAIPTSIQEKKLTFGHGWEMAGVKTPNLEPTLIGAGVSSVITGVQGKGFSPEAQRLATKSPFYIAGSFAGEVLTSLAVGSAVSKAYRLVRGSSRVRIRGGTEVETALETPAQTVRRTTTKLTLSKERISYSAGKQLKEYSRMITPEDIRLGGTEVKMVATTTGQERFVDVVSKGVESTRAAGPYINAVKSMKPQGFLKSISSRLGLSEKAIPSLSSYEKLAKVAGEDLVPAASMSRTERIFTAASMTGKLDPQVYLNFLKNVDPKVAQGWLKQMGGITPPQISQLTKPLPIMLGDIAAFEVPTGTGAFALGSSGAMFRNVSPKPDIVNVPPLVKMSAFSRSKSRPEAIDLTAARQSDYQEPAFKIGPVSGQKEEQLGRFPEPSPVEVPAEFKPPYWLPDMKGDGMRGSSLSDESLDYYWRGRRKWRITTGEEALGILF